MAEVLPHTEQRQQIERQIRELMVTRLHVRAGTVEASGSTTPLLGSGIGLDSMEAMSLAVEIEDAFGIVVRDEDLTEDLFASFDALTDYIIKQRAPCE